MVLSEKDVLILKLALERKLSAQRASNSKKSAIRKRHRPGPYLLLYLPDW